MSEKRRGLGRGLGALIPTGPEGRRPVDVFFPSSEPVDANDVSVLPGGDAIAAATGGGSTSMTVVDGPSDDPAAVESFTAITVDALAELERGAEPTQNGDAAADQSAAPEAVVSRETTAESEPEALPGGGSVDAGSSASALLPVPGATFAELAVETIRPNPRQPRTVFDDGEFDELVGSIREIGVLQPIVVRPIEGEANRYELIMGERRWRATQAAGLETVPAIIRETDDADLLRDALLENLHRSALNPLEEAAAYRQLLDDFGCTHEELAERISRSRPQISNTLRLLRLPPLVQRRVAAGVLSAGHARALLGLTDGGEIERLAQRIVAEGLSVRATEEIVALGGSAEEKAARKPRAGQRSAAIDELASRLSDRFETRVRVDLGKSKGRLTVEFASVEDLNRILDIMAPKDPGLLR